MDTNSKMQAYYTGAYQHRAGLAGPAARAPVSSFLVREGYAPPPLRTGPYRMIGARNNAEALPPPPVPLLGPAAGVTAAPGDPLDGDNVNNGGQGGGHGLAAPQQGASGPPGQPGESSGPASMAMPPPFLPPQPSLPGSLLERDMSVDIKADSPPPAADMYSLPTPAQAPANNNNNSMAMTVMNGGASASEVAALRTVVENLVRGLGKANGDLLSMHSTMNTLRADMSGLRADVSLAKATSDTTLAGLPGLTNSVSNLEAQLGALQNTNLNQVQLRLHRLEQAVADLERRIGQGAPAEVAKLRSVLRSFAGILNSTYNEHFTGFGDEV